jgi:predicted Zn-ribbon and HTH transcriptional regulator
MKIHVHRCLHCGHEWIHTSPDDRELPPKPQRCPKCKSQYWDKVHRIVPDS